MQTMMTATTASKAKRLGPAVGKTQQRTALLWGRPAPIPHKTTILTKGPRTNWTIQPQYSKTQGPQRRTYSRLPARRGMDKPHKPTKKPHMNKLRHDMGTVKLLVDRGNPAPGQLHGPGKAITKTPEAHSTTLQTTNTAATNRFTGRMTGVKKVEGETSERQHKTAGAKRANLQTSKNVNPTQNTPPPPEKRKQKEPNFAKTLTASNKSTKPKRRKNQQKHHNHSVKTTIKTKQDMPKQEETQEPNEHDTPKVTAYRTKRKILHTNGRRASKKREKTDL